MMGDFKFGAVLGLATCALGLLGLNAPPQWWWIGPALFAIVVAALVIAATSDGRYLLFEPGEDFSFLDFAAWGAPLAIAGRAVAGFEVVDYLQPILPAVPIGFGYAYCCHLARLHGSPSPAQLQDLGKVRWLFITIAGIAMGWGLAVQINELGTRGVQRIAGRVIDIKISQGAGRNSKTPYMNIEGIAGGASGSYRVGWDMYSSTYEGQIVCVDTHTGLLGFRWKEVHHC